MSDLFRWRIHYSRGAELRYVGNLDTQQVWERTIRRAHLPIAFSQGFSPRPRFHMAHALPLGFTSRHELLDVWLNEEWDADTLIARLQPSCPPGLILLAAELVSLREPALQVRVESAAYQATLREVPPELDLPASLAQMLAAAALPRIWRKKPYDLRPLIYKLKFTDPSAEGHPRLDMRLSAREGATGRPEEVLAQLGIDSTSARVERTELVLSTLPASLDQPDAVQPRQNLGEVEPVGAEQNRKHGEDEDDQ